MLSFWSVSIFLKSSCWDDEGDGTSVENIYNSKLSSEDYKKYLINSTTTFIYLLQIRKTYIIPSEHPIIKREYKSTNEMHVGSAGNFIWVVNLEY